MYDLLVLPPAMDEIEEASDWYSEQSDRLAREFNDQVLFQLERIRQHPRLYPERFDDLRVSLMKRFPFKILFEVDDAARLIVILSLSHHKRNKPY